MECVLRNSQTHNTFSNLGHANSDGYHVNENCNSALETILQNILTEDKYLRTCRRSISFGHNIKKDLIPLFINTKDEKTIELLIRILVNLTIPIECLLSIDVLSQSDFGRHTIFEINNLLASTKNAFRDDRATKVIVDFLKKNVDMEENDKLQPDQCSNVSNSLLLLRNVLHIPEDNNSQLQNYSGSTHSVQNQILWNIFSQGIDKILVKLMTVPDACYWGVTMIQLIALLYKDQHVVNLQKLLNIWLETSLSESSEDNESNTCRSVRGSKDSTPVLTSESTSDSSDTGASGKTNGGSNPDSNLDSNHDSNLDSNPDSNQSLEPNKLHVEVLEKDKNSSINNNSESMKTENDATVSCSSGVQSQVSQQSDQSDPSQEISEKKIENSDCGYGTQIENQESITTSSNDDEPFKKPVHQKPHNPKQKPNTKVRSGLSLQDRKRKKIVKRAKSNITNVQGLAHKTPTDDDISNVLKEFTVDFLLKGYNPLVQTLHYEILTNMHLEIDTSHFFWLMTYFLKFATQIELDLEHVNSVLCFDMVSFLTAEGVNLCESFELAIKLDGNDLAPCIRRLHLLVTAIREFVQAVDLYKKIKHLNNKDQEALKRLQIKMCESEELRSLLVLLLRHYNPEYQSKQYLQDLIVTNHILLMSLDSVMKLPEYTCSGSMVDHIRQFASPYIMYRYGLLLENYSANGEFVNDCIFTIMHHVGSERESLNSLFQTSILKTFTAIWKNDFEICDDWTDLIEYVINMTAKNPQSVQNSSNLRLDRMAPSETDENDEIEIKTTAEISSVSTSFKERWNEDEISSLNWTYMQCNNSAESINDIIKSLEEEGIIKSRNSVVKELFKQNLINKTEYDEWMKEENDRNTENTQAIKKMRDDEISKLCQELISCGKGKFLDWVQKVLLDTCYAKICLNKKTLEESKLLNIEESKKNEEEMPPASPVSYHFLTLRQSVPLVPWNCQQAAVCKDLKFLRLLNKLGFHMPVDSGKVFIRIPHFWTADFLYDVAGKISPVDTTKLNFSVNEFAETSASKPNNDSAMFNEMHKDVNMTEPANIYQVHKQKHLATMVNFTPMPGCSYNSDGSEVDNHNWLKVVQKSHKLKLSLSLESPVIVEEDVVMIATVETTKATPFIGSIPPLTLPTVLTERQEESAFDTQFDDSESCNQSMCDTASVASDLTRMYVSDEDDKSEDLSRDQSFGFTSYSPQNNFRVEPIGPIFIAPQPRKRSRLACDPTF